MLLPVFQQALKKNVRIYIVTKVLEDLDEKLKLQSETEITNFEMLGIQPLLCTGNHHRKLAIIDRKILWEGSLNILSQTNSREIMRRIHNTYIVEDMLNFLNYIKKIEI